MTSSFGLSPTALGMCDAHILCDTSSKIDNSLRVCIADTSTAKKYFFNMLPSHLVEFSLTELKTFIGRMLFMLRMDNIISIEGKKSANTILEELKIISTSLSSMEEVYLNLINNNKVQANSYNKLKTDITSLISFFEREFTIGVNDSNKKEYSNSYFYSNHILNMEEGLIDTSNVISAIEEDGIINILINTINNIKPVKELDKVTLLLKWILNYVSNIKDTTKEETDKSIKTFKVLIGKLQSTLKYIQVLCNSDTMKGKVTQEVLSQLPIEVQVIIDKLDFIQSKYKTCRRKLLSKHNLRSAIDIYNDIDTFVTSIKENLDIITDTISKVINNDSNASTNTISMLDNVFCQLNNLLLQLTLEKVETKFTYTGNWYFNQTQYAVLGTALSNLVKSYYYLTVKSIEYNSATVTGLNSIETILLGRDLKSRNNLLNDMRDKIMYDMNISLNYPHTLEVKKSYLNSIDKVIRIYTRKLHLLNSLQSNDKEDKGITKSSSNPIEDLQVTALAYTQFKSRLKEEDLAIYLRYGLIEINDSTITEIDNFNVVTKTALYYKTTDNVLKSSSIEKSIQTALNSLREYYKIIEGQIYYYEYCIKNKISLKDLSKSLLA